MSDRIERPSPLPRMGDTRGTDWGRLIAIVLLSSLGSGGVGAFGVSQLTQYRIDRLEREFAQHESVPHRTTAHGIDANKLRVEENARQIREMREEMREGFESLREQIDALNGRRQR